MDCENEEKDGLSTGRQKAYEGMVKREPQTGEREVDTFLLLPPAAGLIIQLHDATLRFSFYFWILLAPLIKFLFRKMQLTFLACESLDSEKPLLDPSSFLLLIQNHACRSQKGQQHLSLENSCTNFKSILWKDTKGDNKAKETSRCLASPATLTEYMVVGDHRQLPARAGWVTYHLNGLSKFSMTCLMSFILLKLI